MTSEGQQLEPAGHAAPVRPPRILHLVRIRLWLALLTMGVVPLAVATALLYATLESQSLGQQIGVRAATVSASGTLGARLDMAAGSLRLMASDATLRELTGAAPGESASGAALGRAERTLRAAAAVLGDVMRGAWLIDSRGQAVAGLEGNAWRVGTAARLPQARELDGRARSGQSERVHSAVTGSGGVAMVVRLTATAQTGLVRLELDLERLLAQAIGGGAVGARAMLITTEGEVLASGTAGPGAPEQPAGKGLDEVLPTEAAERADFLAALARHSSAQADAVASGGWVVGSSMVSTTSGAGWSLLVFEPAPTGPSAHLVGLVLGLAVVLLVLTFWMSRQIVRPAEELERSRQEIHRQYEIARADSLRDALTGLGNHRAFQEELDRQLEWYRRYKVPVALLLIDIDDLKLVNDSEGHGAGDDLLREIGRLIGQVARYADRSFRIGGDEFAILMPHTDADGAMQLGRRLLDRATQKRAVGRPIPFSAGVSSCPALATTRTQLYAQADAALYWCKRHGRATIDVFDPVRDRQANQEATSELSALIARVSATESMLRAAYQPIVDLASGQVIGFEGLTRPQPESGFTDPASMFVAAESVGRTVELDQACVETVVRGARGLAPHQLLSINLSPRFVEAPHFSVDALLTVLARYGLEPTRVIVELTEREHIEDLLRLQRNLAALQRAGIRVAADDVGAGNAGLRLLSQFRFDIVKIDLSLVQDGTQRDSSRAVLRSLRELASRWGAFMIAEGLETVGQLRAVRELGIAAGQGYLLSRPMPVPNVTRVDLRTIEAGGVVLNVRSRDHANDLAGAAHAPVAQPGTP